MSAFHHSLRGRFQWPSWLLNWAWHRQATPYVAPRPEYRITHDPEGEQR